MITCICFTVGGCTTTSFKKKEALSVTRFVKPLKGPFDRKKLFRIFQGHAINFVCESPPSPVQNLTFEGFYRAGTGSSVVDKDAMRRYRAERKPVDDFTNQIIKMSDQYLAETSPNSKVARCVLNWLSHWAEGNAFLGNMSHQGRFVRKWELGTISLAYLKIRNEENLQSAKKNLVKKWIKKWADDVYEDYSSRLNLNSRNNNHAYWASWSVGLAGVVLNNRKFFDWMVERHYEAMQQIEEDGTLPLEMARRSKALHYHVYSAQALVMVAELAAQNGIELFDIEGGALHRLINRIIAGLSKPYYFEEKTGKTQSWVGKLQGGKFAWMEPYYKRYPNEKIKKWIKKFRIAKRCRCLKNRRIGGNSTLLYGAPIE